MASFGGVAVALTGLFAAISSAGPIRLRADQLAAPGTAKFDYVVIGGGTAGLTIAARLAETASVAVVEAGGYYQVDYGNATVVPLLSLTGIDVINPTTSFPRRPEIDWELVTEPLSNVGNRVVHYAQGKTLGGSSALNTMSYTRSSKSAYQRWADKVGDQSYKFDNVLPFYKKSVRLTPPNLAKRNAANATPEWDSNSFGNGGPLDVSWNNWVDPSLTWLAKAQQAIGLTINPKGFSAGQLQGGSWVPATIDPAHATRESSQTSFLQRALANTSLKVYPRTQATKLLFKGTKVVGVSVQSNGTTFALSARKEVIVSAGVFHSPQLLMVSGIGPKATLQALNISVVKDLPGVGQNLRDPISVGVGHLISTQSGQAIVANPATQPEALRQYKEEAAGPYSSVAGYMSFDRIPADIRSTLPAATQAKLATLPSDGPEIQLIVGTVLQANGTSLGSMSVTISNPFSSGSVTINSSSIASKPVINLGWLSDSADGDVLIAGIKRLRQAWASAPAQSIRLGAEVRPGETVDTDEELLAYVKSSANMLWHPSSTCSMGKVGDANAVVDSKARVIGVKGLRVVDMSIVPFGLPGQPQSTAYMLGEKIADAIKKGL